jgi:Tfp pilus assembly protein PilN
MIEINLLPGARKKKAARGPAFDFSSVRSSFARAGDPWLLGTIAVCTVTVAVVGWMYWSQGRAQTAAETRLDKALTDSGHYQTVLRDRHRAEARYDTVLRQLNLIRTIDGDRYIWAHVLDEVSRALPPFTWITSITYSGTPQGATNAVALPPAPKDTGKAAGKAKRLNTEIPKDPVRLVGRTVDIQALTRFMRELASSPFLANVQLDQSQLSTDEGKEVTQFQLTMDYTRPDSALLRRVPLVVTGQ